ncbi:MAG TPA: hypothetical protein PLV25_02000 [Opitutales bacterium]|nr:hypothetical protein [Opitutales bacterium]
MKITLGYYSFNKGVLEGPLDLKTEATRAIQAVESIGAGVVKHIDRGNLRARVSFAIKRMHDASEAAMRFALRHPTELVEVRGVLTMQGQNHCVEMPDALIESVDCSVQGIVTTTRYCIVGGLAQELAKGGT